MSDAETIQGSEGTQKRKRADFFARFQSASPFAKSFLEGLVAGIVVFALLLGWMAMRSERTAENVQSFIPFKTTKIDADSAPAPQPVVIAPTGQTPVAKAEIALPAAPLEGLTETKGDLTLPISRLSDDMTPFQAYKRPFTAQAGKAAVAIVVVDYGLSDSLSQSALANLPANVSLVLTSYADDAPRWASEARAHGHEFWLSLPMETRDTAAEDTGPNTLMINAALQENQKRLFAVMGAVTGYAGMVSQKDHKFTQQDLDVNPVLKQIFGRGLAFAESNPGGTPFGLKMATEAGYPYVQNSLWLDADLRPESIDRALQILELQATKNGRAIAFVQPYPVVLNKIQDWIKGANDRGLQIVPLSALVQ